MKRGERTRRKKKIKIGKTKSLTAAASLTQANKHHGHFSITEIQIQAKLWTKV